MAKIVGNVIVVILEEKWSDLVKKRVRYGENGEIRDLGFGKGKGWVSANRFKLKLILKGPGGVA